MAAFGKSRNVIIGTNSIVGAGSLVNQSVQGKVLVAGVPAKFKKNHD